MSLVLEISRTLDELDPQAWREPTFDSHLVKTCHALRRKPLREFSSEDPGDLLAAVLGAGPDVWLGEPV